MKIQYRGTDVVDIPGHDGVEPGQTVEVDDMVGERLLLAGASCADDGTVTPPADPLWARASKKDTPTPSPADAGKES